MGKYPYKTYELIGFQWGKDYLKARSRKEAIKLFKIKYGYDATDVNLWAR